MGINGSLNYDIAIPSVLVVSCRVTVMRAYVCRPHINSHLHLKSDDHEVPCHLSHQHQMKHLTEVCEENMLPWTDFNNSCFFFKHWLLTLICLNIVIIWHPFWTIWIVYTLIFFKELMESILHYYQTWSSAPSSVQLPTPAYDLWF